MGDPIEEVKAVIEGVKRDADLLDYYDGWFSDIPRSERHRAVLELLVERHREYEKVCKLAFELYLAGTGQSNAPFSGTKGDPVEEVIRSRGRLMARGLGIRPDDTTTPGDVRQAAKKVGACPPECGEMHTYESGCRMFTFGSGYAPGVRDERENP